MTDWLIPGYFIRSGSGLDRALLVKFMQQTYQELYPDRSFAHLAETVDRYLSAETPLWWVEAKPDPDGSPGNHRLNPQVNPQPSDTRSTLHAPVACLWLGSAIDQIRGDCHTYIFLLYVHPEHRRLGIGSALMQRAEAWAKAKGDRQIGLQVFHHNQPALNLYEKLGYQTQSIWMMKQL